MELTEVAAQPSTHCSLSNGGKQNTDYCFFSLLFLNHYTQHTPDHLCSCEAKSFLAFGNQCQRFFPRGFLSHQKPKQNWTSGQLLPD